LDKLEDLIERKHLWGTAFVNMDDFFTIVNKLRASLPEDMRSAQRITRDADQVIGEAKEQGSRIIDQAKIAAAKVVEDGKTEQARLIEESEIKRMAILQAKEIVASAEEEAQATKAGADSYAREVLDDLQNFVGKVAKTIQLGKDKLEQKSTESRNG
jgi:cell division septum initiation protein DivIVA